MTGRVERDSVLGWIRGGEGEMRWETHTHAGAVGAVFVYSIRTCAEFNCACVLLRARGTVPCAILLSFLASWKPKR